MNTNLHAHLFTASRDCDGSYSSEYVMRYNDAEIRESVEAQGVNDFSDIHFMERVMMSVASPYAAQEMTVTVDERGFQVNERTEEGYRAADVTWCRDGYCL